MTKKTTQQIAEIHAVAVFGAPSDASLRKVARAVVDARHHQGDDGWDRLKNAIAELEALVGRSS